ncbi:MAG: S8 family serine peptidase [Alphaproteobacteria bacterium]|jgi:hypothetical protein
MALLLLAGSISVHAGRNEFDAEILALHARGYTGKNVKIGVIDDFDGEKSHGDAVCALIKKVAPDAQIVTQAVMKPKQKAGKKHKAIKSISQRVFERLGDREQGLTIKARAPLILYALEQTSRKRHPIDMLDCLKGPRTYLTSLSLEICETVTLKCVPGWPELYQMSHFDKLYHVLFDDLKQQDLVVVMTPRMQEKITPGKTALSPLGSFMNQGVKIVNLSLTRSWHQESVDEFETFAKTGGVLIKSAGNTPISLGVSDIPLEYWDSTFAPDVRALLQNTIASRLLDSPHKKACLFVGAVDNALKITPYSARAGLFKKQYVTAPLTQNEDGTSYAAPLVTGLMALLQEAYESYAPSTLFKAIRKTATPLPHDSQRDVGGLGVIQPLAVFEKGQGLV